MDFGVRSEVATLLLFGLNRFKQCFEITGTEALMVSALDYLQKEGGSVLERLGEDLQQVALVVVVDEDLLPLQNVDVLLHLDGDVLEAGSQVVVVGVGDLVEELDATVFHARDRLDNRLGAHGDVLDARTAIILAELLDLTLTLAIGRLVNRHLDFLVEVGHDHRAKRAVIRVDHLVIN